MSDLDRRFSVQTGDITAIAADAIVNAANSSLLGGGGVDGAIHRAAGPGLLQACRTLRATTLPDGLATGAAVATPAGNLPAHYVFHTVGPVWRGGDAGEPELLASCVRSCFALIEEHPEVTTIAFPAISTGVYRFPKALAFPILDREIRAGLATHRAVSARLVLFSHEDETHYRALCH